MAAHERADPARLPQRIQLVDEDDARGLLLGLGEEVADAGRPHTDEHLDEVRAAQAEERHAGFSRDGLGQERLPGAGRADDEHPFGDLAAEAPVAIGVLEEVHDLHQLSPRLVDARDVVERDAGLVLDVDPGLALADGHQPLLRAEAAHEEDPHAGEHHRRKDPGEEGREPGILHVPRELDVRLLELGHQPGILDPRRHEAMRSGAQPVQLLELLLREHGFEPIGRERAADGFSIEGEIADLALLRKRLELAVRHVRGPRPEERELKDENRDEGDREIADRELSLFEFHARASRLRALARRQVVLVRSPARFGRGPSRFRLAPRCAAPARTSSAGPFSEVMDIPPEPRSDPTGPPPLGAAPRCRNVPGSPVSRCRTP